MLHVLPGRMLTIAICAAAGCVFWPDEQLIQLVLRFRANGQLLPQITKDQAGLPHRFGRALTLDVVAMLLC